MNHLDVRIEREVIGKGDKIFLDLFCWSHKPEDHTSYFSLISAYNLDQFGF